MISLLSLALLLSVIFDSKEIIGRGTVFSKQGAYPVCVERQISCISIRGTTVTSDLKIKHCPGGPVVDCFSNAGGMGSIFCSAAAKINK